MTKTETPIALPCSADVLGDSIDDATGRIVMVMLDDHELPETVAQRDYVLRAVNSYEAMKEAMREAWEPWEKLMREKKIGPGGWPASLEKIRAFLAAEGRQ